MTEMEIDPTTSSAISIRNLSFRFTTTDARSKEILRGVNVDVPYGARVLLVGPNGAGKSTLLRLIAGRNLTEDRESVLVMGKPAFYQTLGISGISFLGNSTWQRSIAFVGSSVTYEADIAAGDMMKDLQEEFKERRDELVRILDIDLTWKLNAVSDGQRRRVQIMLGLLRPFKILLVDEVCVDLDVLARASFLEYLKMESIQRGCTVLYCTHIFDGLDEWPTQVMFIGEGQVKRLTPAPLPEPLYRAAMKFMKEERELSRLAKSNGANAGELLEPFGGQGYSHGRLVPSTSVSRATLATSRFDAYR